MGGLSPPYGDCTEILVVRASFAEFSPPYEDGTKKFEIELGIHQFLPPYGDKLKCEMARNMANGIMFPSPCGDNLKSVVR